MGVMWAVPTVEPSQGPLNLGEQMPGLPSRFLPCGYQINALVVPTRVRQHLGWLLGGFDPQMSEISQVNRHSSVSAIPTFLIAIDFSNYYIILNLIIRTRNCQQTGYLLDSLISLVNLLEHCARQVMIY